MCTILYGGIETHRNMQADRRNRQVGPIMYWIEHTIQAPARRNHRTIVQSPAGEQPLPSIGEIGVNRNLVDNEIALLCLSRTIWLIPEFLEFSQSDPEICSHRHE